MTPFLETWGKGPADTVFPLTPFSFAKNTRRRSVAVGTAIADRPPHRSVRAALPDTALTLDDGVEAKLHFAHAA